MMKTNKNGKNRKELNLKELEAVNGAGVWEWIGINIVYPLGRALPKKRDGECKGLPVPRL